ncbi:MAG: prepilin-type N-terminal cleavage/methylation domain-containing protein [Planctomycetes bacterium]|nr:prepilin-type N-terminal cleavage/methylation domain-containing protein [Planctomycetota bacterium]
MMHTNEAPNRQRGFTIVELMVVLSVLVPVLVSVTSLVIKHQELARVNNADPRVGQQRARVLRALTMDLHAAHEVTRVADGIDIHQTTGVTRWSVEDGILHRRGSNPIRMQGVNGLRYETQPGSALATITLWRGLPGNESEVLRVVAYLDERHGTARENR